MQVKMSYGRQGLSLDFPDTCQMDVIHKKSMPVLPDPGLAVRQAFDSPVGSLSLKEEARGRKNACILICDITRPVPNHLLLPAIVSELTAAGLEQKDILVLVATGLHRPNEGSELRELIGDDWVFENIRIENHFARNDADHVEVGRTRRGTVIRLDRRLVEADLRLATGLVEPHFMAGYSGGRKVVIPGVTHHDTIRRLHAASILEDPKAVNCCLEDNPLHREQIEGVGFLGRTLSLNTVITEKRELSFVNFGEVNQSHLQAVDFVRPFAEAHLDRAYHTVVTSSAGYPLDKTYYQTVKGMVGAMDIIEPGGDIFIVSEISEGLGSPEYVAAQERLVQLGPEAFIQGIEPKSRADIDEWQTEEQVRAMRKGRIHLYTKGLNQEESRLTGVNVFDDPARFLEAIKKSAARDGRIAVIPEGPYILPFSNRKQCAC